MIEVLLVGLGGALGAISRYLIGLAVGMPLLATLAINVAGSLLIGLVSGMTHGRTALFATVGFCGGFTTFSTFSAQTLALLQGGMYFQAGLYALGSVTLCVLAALAGFVIANQLTQ